MKNKIQSWKSPALFSRVDKKKSLDPAEVNALLVNRAALIQKESEALTDTPDSSESK